MYLFFVHFLEYVQLFLDYLDEESEQFSNR